MTSEQMERVIEFLLDHHAKFSANIGELKEVQRRQTENLDKLTTAVTHMQQEMAANRQEIREAIDNLIIANEGSRHLAEQATKLQS
jgi:tetrahydrodipicolinate N-succinyltransferase